MGIRRNTRHAKSLSLIKEGKWNEAHEIVQDDTDRLSCLIHALLHRIEGGLGNARYWYAEAGEQMPDNTVEEELERLFSIANKD